MQYKIQKNEALDMLFGDAGKNRDDALLESVDTYGNCSKIIVRSMVNGDNGEKVREIVDGARLLDAIRKLNIELGENDFHEIECPHEAHMLYYKLSRMNDKTKRKIPTYQKYTIAYKFHEDILAYGKKEFKADIGWVRLKWPDLTVFVCKLSDVGSKQYKIFRNMIDDGEKALLKAMKYGEMSPNKAFELYMAKKSPPVEVEKSCPDTNICPGLTELSSDMPYNYCIEVMNREFKFRFLPNKGEMLAFMRDNPDAHLMEVVTKGKAPEVMYFAFPMDYDFLDTVIYCEKSAVFKGLRNVIKRYRCNINKHETAYRLSWQYPERPTPYAFDQSLQVVGKNNTIKVLDSVTLNPVAFAKLYDALKLAAKFSKDIIFKNGAIQQMFLHKEIVERSQSIIATGVPVLCDDFVLSKASKHLGFLKHLVIEGFPVRIDFAVVDDKPTYIFHEIGRCNGFPSANGEYSTVSCSYAFHKPLMSDLNSAALSNTQFANIQNSTNALILKHNIDKMLRGRIQACHTAFKKNYWHYVDIHDGWAHFVISNNQYGVYRNAYKLFKAEVDPIYNGHANWIDLNPSTATNEDAELELYTHPEVGLAQRVTSHYNDIPMDAWSICIPVFVCTKCQNRCMLSPDQRSAAGGIFPTAQCAR